MKLLYVLTAFFLASLSALSTEHNQLTEEETAAGWLLLFDGKTLDGWRSYRKTKISAKHWKVENGEIVKIKGSWGDHIVTTKKFGDYILSWDWKLDKKGNNGIKYMVPSKPVTSPGPEYQMLDDQRHPDAKKGSKRQTAALYDIFAAKTDGIAKEAGEWNTSQIQIKGNTVEHWLNGKLVLEYELGSEALANAIAKSKFKKVKNFAQKSEGHIMITNHLDGCVFRNIKLLPLNKN